jgi:enoyl-CoA hydratase
MEHLIFQIENKIAKLIFNRPEVLNALNEPLLNEFGTVLDNLEANTDIRSLILTGAGDRAFVAGADISGFKGMTPLGGKRFAEKGQKLLSRLESLPIPVIAAVNGFALGGGTEISLACDFIYASKNAVFGLPEIKLGLIPGFGGTQRLGKLIGTNLANEMIFTGKSISADEALEYGIVNRVCEPKSLMDEVMKTAVSITEKGAVCLSKDFDLANGCRFEADAFALCMASKDAAEGADAFLEKRKPVFNGGFCR